MQIGNFSSKACTVFKITSQFINRKILTKILKYFHNIWDYWVDFGVKNISLPICHNIQGVCKIQVLALDHTQSCQTLLKKKNLNIHKKV